MTSETLRHPHATRVAPFDPEKRQREITSLIPMTRNIARGLAKFARGADFGDCFHDGCLGIIRAVDTYDPSRGISLQRYARTIVTGAILNGLRSRDPISEVARRRLRFAEDRRFALAQQIGRLPSMQEMETDEPELRGARLVAHRSAAYSLDAPLPPGEREAADWTADPARIVEERSDTRAIAAALEKLSAIQRRVILGHYYGGKTATAIGKELNLTPQRISQIRSAALATLRQSLES